MLKNSTFSPSISLSSVLESIDNRYIDNRGKQSFFKKRRPRQKNFDIKQLQFMYLDIGWSMNNLNSFTNLATSVNLSHKKEAGVRELKSETS